MTPNPHPEILAGVPSRAPLMTPVLLGLTAVTGIVDAVCFLALGHVFTANMTGNVVLLGFAFAGVESLSAIRSATALVAFLIGAVMGVRLSKSTSALTTHRWPAAAFGVEAALLFGSAVVAAWGVAGTAAATAVTIVIVSTGLAMGLRSATIRQLGESGFSTTVLTMTLTGIAADSVFAGGTNRGLVKRIGSVACMVLGATAGAWFLARSAALALAVAGAASSACAVAAYHGMRPLPTTEHTTHGGDHPRGDRLVTALQMERSGT